MSVHVVERQAMAPIRNRQFFTLAELNAALKARVDAINSRPFQKKEGSRASIFNGQEKDALIPLPATPYEIVTQKQAKVNFNYHVSFDGRWYSVPFEYVKRDVTISATPTTIKITCDGERIAMHKRSYLPKGSYSTNKNHMPEAHKDFTEWNGDRFRRWASDIGPACAQTIDVVLKSRTIEQQSYRSCRGLLGLAKTYGRDTLEQACAKALSLTNYPSYKTVKNIIPSIKAKEPEVGSQYAILRGKEYYKSLESSNNVDRQE
jgi:hypothetical protein